MKEQSQRAVLPELDVAFACSQPSPADHDELLLGPNSAGDGFVWRYYGGVSLLHSELVGVICSHRCGHGLCHGIHGPGYIVGLVEKEEHVRIAEDPAIRQLSAHIAI
jgi:hypothetical protein